MSNTEKPDIGVLGAGTWGCTLAALLAGKGCKPGLWDYSPDVMDRLEDTRIPARLPHLTLPPSVRMERTLDQIARNAEFLVIVIPSHGVRSLCEHLRKTQLDLSSKRFVLCSKGFERETLLPLHNVMEQVLGKDIHRQICLLSGPSHAEEVSRRMPTTVVSCSFSPELAGRVQGIFHTEFFRVYTQEDVLGVELGGAVKNVIAIAAGVCDGLGFGDNSRAALITRGLAEMIRLGIAMGARIDTFSGLAGVGDLIVTTTSRHSRNRNFGELLARGRSVKQALDEIGMVVEGVNTAHSVMALGEKYNVAMPISRETYRIIYEGKKPEDAVRDLLERAPKPEIYT